MDCLRKRIRGIRHDFVVGWLVIMRVVVLKSSRSTEKMSNVTTRVVCDNLPAIKIFPLLTN